MPTTVTKTVGPGKDYENLPAALAAEARDLVAADEICDLVVYAMVETTAFDAGAGFTTDATRYLRVRVNPADRHDGTRSSTKFRIRTNTDFGNALNIGGDYTRIEGFQVTNIAANGTGILVDAVGVQIIDTLVYDCGSRGIAGAVNHRVVMNNVAVMNCGGYGIGRTIGLDGHTTCYNCTVVACGGIGFVGYISFGNTSTFKNCYSGGNGGADFDDTNGLTIVTCFSEDGSASTPTAAYRVNSGARFRSVTDGSEDVHHGGSSTLRHAGTNLSLDANWIHPGGTVDIDGEDRGSTWDVGIDQTPPDAVPNLVAPTIAGRAFTGETLTATGGVWTGADSTSGKWQRETGVGTEVYEDIVGEVALTYEITEADARRRVRYMETATNEDGSTSYPSDPCDEIGTTAPFPAELELEVSDIFAINLPRYTYLAVTEDAGRRIVFVETATNEAGSTDAETTPFGPLGSGLAYTSGLEMQTDMTVEIPLTEDEVELAPPNVVGGAGAFMLMFT